MQKATVGLSLVVLGALRAGALEPWPAPEARPVEDVRRELRRAYAGAEPQLPIDEPAPDWLDASLRDALAKSTTGRKNQRRRRARGKRRRGDAATAGPRAIEPAARAERRPGR